MVRENYLYLCSLIHTLIDQSVKETRLNFSLVYLSCPDLIEESDTYTRVNIISV